MNMLKTKSGKQSHSQQPQKSINLKNLIKDFKNLYNENYKVLKKEIIGDTRPPMFMDWPNKYY
jgi:hypothetical protein